MPDSVSVPSDGLWHSAVLARPEKLQVFSAPVVTVSSTPLPPPQNWHLPEDLHTSNPPRDSASEWLLSGQELDYGDVCSILKPNRIALSSGNGDTAEPIDIGRNSGHGSKPSMAQRGTHYRTRWYSHGGFYWKENLGSRFIFSFQGLNLKSLNLKLAVLTAVRATTWASKPVGGLPLRLGMMSDIRRVWSENIL